jgi:hypothetical protein
MKEKLFAEFQSLDSDLSSALYCRYYTHIITANVDESQYFERHHILPKAIFPEYRNEKWNIVRLSAKDHFIAHHLLFTMFPKHPKIVAAMWGMCNQVSPNHQKDFLQEHLNEVSDLYSKVRSAHAENVRARQLVANPMKGRTGSDSPLYGRKRPAEVVDKMKQNHWSKWRKPWDHNRARTEAWVSAPAAYDLWLEHECGYVRLDSLLNKPSQTFKTIHEHFKKGWNPHTDAEFQQWLSLHVQDLP